MLNDFLLWFGEVMPNIFEDTISNGATWIVLIVCVIFPIVLIIVDKLSPDKYVPKTNVTRRSDDYSDYIIDDVEGNYESKPNCNLIYDGAMPIGQPMYNIQGNLFYEGALPIGQPIANMQGNLLYEGMLPIGQPKYNIQGNLIYEGALPIGQPIANIQDGLLYEGALPIGQPIANVQDGSIKIV